MRHGCQPAGGTGGRHGSAGRSGGPGVIAAAGGPPAATSVGSAPNARIGKQKAGRRCSQRAKALHGIRLPHAGPAQDRLNAAR
jgi:hypothetical protein